MIVMGMVVIITSKDYRVRPVTPMCVPMPMAAMAVAMSRATSKTKTLHYQILEIFISDFNNDYMDQILLNVD